MDVGVIGLGRMGLAMARNLVKAGHQVRGWNRSHVAEDALPSSQIVPTAADAFDADAVITMLSDDDAVRSVVLDSGALDRARPGLVHVVTATISVDFAEELTAAHAAKGLGYVSAPVFGRPDVAEAGRLNVAAAGEPGAVERVRPLLDAVSQRVFVMGETPSQANAAKIAGNMMIAMAIEALAEAAVLTGAHGVERGAFYDLMLQTLFGGRAYETYGAKIRDDDYEPGFRLALGLKDLRLAAAAAEPAGRTLVMLDAVREQMARAADAGLADRDWSALADFTIHGPRG